MHYLKYCNKNQQDVCQLSFASPYWLIQNRALKETFTLDNASSRIAYEKVDITSAANVLLSLVETKPADLE